MNQFVVTCSVLALALQACGSKSKGSNDEKPAEIPAFPAQAEVKKDSGNPSAESEKSKTDTLNAEAKQDSKPVSTVIGEKTAQMAQAAGGKLDPIQAIIALKSEIPAGKPIDVATGLALLPKIQQYLPKCSQNLLFTALLGQMKGCAYASWNSINKDNCLLKSNVPIDPVSEEQCKLKCDSIRQLDVQNGTASNTSFPAGEQYRNQGACLLVSTSGIPVNIKEYKD